MEEQPFTTCLLQQWTFKTIALQKPVKEVGPIQTCAYNIFHVRKAIIKKSHLISVINDDLTPHANLHKNIFPTHFLQKRRQLF